MSFYLKYRPQRTQELDIAKVRDFFEKILTSGKVSHAYLFTGPRGTGKTSAARILAKLVNCERSRSEKQKSLPEPCNRCTTCKTITSGSYADLIEIDAASNRGIDDIRALREKIGLAPVMAKKKVYIIDEVHMLTREAFNALLKTLEEPPEHALFVLATTEVDKVPETIRSRCVQLTFSKANRKEVVRSLKKAVKGEKLSVSDGVLDEISSGVDGSFREGMKILEQLSMGKGKITLQKAQKEMGTAEDMQPNKFLKALFDRDLRKAISELDRVEKAGVDLQVFYRESVENLRRLLLAKYGIGEVGDESLNAISKSEVESLIDLFLQKANQFGKTEIAQLPLELVSIAWCETNTSDKQEGEELGKQKDAEPLPKERKLKTGNGEEGATAIKPKGKATSNIQAVEDKWAEVLKVVKPQNHSVEGLLRSTKPVEVRGDVLRVEVFYQFHLDQLKQNKFLQMVEGAIEKVMSEKLRVDYYLGEKQKKINENLENIGTVGKEDDDIVKVAEEVFGVN